MMRLGNDDFYIELIESLLVEAGNFFPDATPYRSARISFYRAIKKRIYQFIHTYFKYSLFTFDYQLAKYRGDFNHYAALYSLLSNPESKALLVRLLSYSLFGYQKVRLPAWQLHLEHKTQIENLKQQNDWIDAVFPPDNKLYKYALDCFGLNLSLYTHPSGILSLFVCKQYSYSSPGNDCQVEPGDCVIDAGGCWGDSALYFAHQAGEKGKVFCFEFVPGNVSIINTNIQCNPHLKERVEIVQNPIWSESGRTLYYDDNGPATRVNDIPFKGHIGQTQTLSIDDFTQGRQIPAVHFIKMDIEGAELEALKGAADTIKRFRPKLAISVYHKPEDLFVIPEYIVSLCPDYQFYLGQYSFWRDEIIFYAKPKKTI
jgi:FkbM family methyltransferase